MAEKKTPAKKGKADPKSAAKKTAAPKAKAAPKAAAKTKTAEPGKKKTAPKPAAKKSAAPKAKAAPKAAAKTKTAEPEKKKTAPKPAAKSKPAAKPKAAPKTAAKKDTAAKAPAKTKAAAQDKKKAAPKSVARKTPAQCIFDLYNLKFGMKKDDVALVLDLTEEGDVKEEALLKAGAYLIQVFFDHRDLLWQVKAYYHIDSQSQAEEMLDRMSKDYRFQTPSSRVAFELDEEEDGTFKMYIRYSEINIKRAFIHHQMALGAAKLAKIEEEEKQKKMVEELEDEDYIPTGPMMF